MKFLVTGGAGFIGCNLVRRLLARGAGVRIFDNFSTGKRQNIQALLTSRPESNATDTRNASQRTSNAVPLEVVEGDLRDFDLLKDAMKGVEVVYHEAALPSVYRSIVAPNTTNQVNVTGTLNVLQAARMSGVRRVVYASSSSIYGDSPVLPKTEDILPQPMSPYAVSKIAGEHYCRSFSHIYGLETVILRYFNVYGPHQDPTSEYSGVIAKFINALLDNKPLVVYGDGEQTRDFTYVDDIVEANLLAAEAPVSGEVMNLAGGNRHSLNVMIGILKSIFQAPDHKVAYAPARVGDIEHSQADVTRLRARLAFTAAVSFTTGLARTVDWYKANRT